MRHVSYETCETCPRVGWSGRDHLLVLTPESDEIDQEIENLNAGYLKQIGTIIVNFRQRKCQ